MRNPVTFEEIRDAVQSMHLAVPKFGLTPDTLPQIVRVYREVLESYDDEVVRGAAALLLKTTLRFPTPSAWLDACHTWVKHNRIYVERQPELDIAGNDIVCRVCRSVPRWALLRMNATPFSAPMTEPRVNEAGVPLKMGETMRRIAVCDKSRHHTPHGITELPENFIAWC